MSNQGPVYGLKYQLQQKMKEGIPYKNVGGSKG